MKRDWAGILRLLFIGGILTVIMVIPCFFLIGMAIFPHTHPDLWPSWLNTASLATAGGVAAAVVLLIRRRADRNWK